MDHVSDLLVPAESAGSSTLPGRRLHHRQKLSTIAYVNLNHANGGIVRDISEAGLAIQTVVPLRASQPIDLRFDLLRPRLHFESQGRVAWADSRGQAGVQFLNLDGRGRRSLKDWIFTQLLGRAHQIAETGFVFTPAEPDVASAALHFSATPRPAIRLEPANIRTSYAPPQPDWPAQGLPSLHSMDRADSSDDEGLSWFASADPRRLLARSIDGVILLLAVVLFCALAIEVTHTYPPWPSDGALAAIATVVFAVVYWLLFVKWLGNTPGAGVVQFAIGDVIGEEEEARPRFR